jgi:DNA-binding SARP family transcriptional activator
MRYSIDAIELASKTKHLAYLCGELAGAPDFQAFLEARLPRSESVRRLWEGRGEAKRTLAILRTQGGAGVAGPGIVIRSLGVEGLLVNGRETYLKPLFAEVFFYLLDKKEVNQDELLETFWPAKSQEKQRASAHAAVYSIRKSLGQDAVLVRGEAMAIGEDLAGTGDAEDFARMARQELSALKAGYGNLERCEDAVSLYGGPFLPGRSRQWVLDRRRMLDALFRQLVLAYANESVRRGRGEEALPAIARALGYDPLDERPTMVAAQIYAGIGRRAHGLYTLSCFRALLKKELGLDPSEEFIVIERALAQGSHADIAGDSGVAGNGSPVTPHSDGCFNQSRTGPMTQLAPGS